MIPVVSIAIPTRKRPKPLMAAVRSVWATVKKRDNAEVIVRCSNDDEATIKLVPELHELGCKVIVGDVLKGYQNHCAVLDEAFANATGNWVCGPSDDSELLDSGNWIAQLEKLPLSGVIALPEIHQLGSSTYRQDMACPLLIIPRDCWKKLGEEIIPYPADTGLFRLLRGAKWRTEFLKGLTWHHHNLPHVVG